jgi:hypothetical protein
MCNRRVRGHFSSALQIIGGLIFAKIMTLKKLGNQNYLGALLCCTTHKSFGGCDVLVNRS